MGNVTLNLGKAPPGASEDAPTHFVGTRLALPTWFMYLVIIILSPVLVLSFSVFDDPLEPDPAQLKPVDAFQFSAAEQPPDSGWLPVEAYDPALAPDTELFSVWLAHRIDPQTIDPDVLYGVYIPHIYSNFSVFAGKSLIGQTATMTRPLYINRVPRLYPVSGSQLLAGDGHVTIHNVLEVEAHAPYRLYVAPYQELVGPYESLRLYHVIIPMLALITIVVVAVAVLILFILEPSQASYGWYALTLTLFAGHSAWPLVGDTPVPAEYWNLIGRLMLLMSITTIIFYHRYFNQYRPRTEWAVCLLVGFPAICLSVASINESGYVLWMNIFSIAASLTTLYANAFLWWMVARWRNLESWALAVVSANGFLVTNRDALFQLGLVESGTQYYMQYYSTINALVFGFLLLRRFSASMREVSDLNTHLEDRVMEKTAELAQEQSRRTLAEERSRIMRDMHDGLGGQLIHALSLADRGADAPRLREALDLAIKDLRLIIDSLAPEESTVTKLIASFRHRSRPMIEQAGLRATWDIDDALDVQVSPKQALAMLRFFQEAVTNVVKHANADTVTISVKQADDGQIRCAVLDNGQGFELGKTTGRGLNHLKIRAQEMGGVLNCQTSKGQTLIETTLRLAEV